MNRAGVGVVSVRASILATALLTIGLGLGAFDGRAHAPSPASVTPAGGVMPRGASPAPADLVPSCHGKDASDDLSSEMLAPDISVARSAIVGMLPHAAEGWLLAQEVCHEFRFMYDYDSRNGFSERWCAAPPEGTVVAVAWLEDGALAVFVLAEGLWTPRPQPSGDWGC